MVRKSREAGSLVCFSVGDPDAWQEGYKGGGVGKDIQEGFPLPNPNLNSACGFSLWGFQNDILASYGNSGSVPV